MRTAVLIAVVMAVVICMAPAYCQGGPGGPMPGGPMPMPGAPMPAPPPAAIIGGLTEMLQLTDNQATELEKVLVEVEGKILPLIGKLTEANQALHEAFVTGDFESAIEPAKAVTNAEFAVMKAVIEGWLKIKNSGILTADQFAKLLPDQSAGGRSQGRVNR